MNKTIWMGVVVAIIFGGGGFYGGMVYAQGQSSSGGAQTTRGAGGNFAGRGGAGRGGAVFGTIISKDATSITVQLGSFGSSTPSGTGTKIVLYDPSTQIGKNVAGTANDLSVGEMITANGTANSDGSVTATMIQIRPAGSGPRGQ